MVGLRGLRRHEEPRFQSVPIRRQCWFILIVISPIAFFPAEASPKRGFQTAAFSRDRFIGAVVRFDPCPIPSRKGRGTPFRAACFLSPSPRESSREGARGGALRESVERTPGMSPGKGRPASRLSVASEVSGLGLGFLLSREHEREG